MGALTVTQTLVLLTGSAGNRTVVHLNPHFKNFVKPFFVLRNYKAPIKRLLYLLLFAFQFSFGQSSADRDKIQRALDSLSIPLNHPKSPSGFIMTYGCDSIPYFKKVNGDTILFLKPASMTPMTYDSPYSFNSFSNWLKTKKENPPTFPSRFASDNRIEIVHYSEITFLIQNDSLFELVLNRDDFIDEMFKSINKYNKGKIDSTTLEKRLDKAAKKEKSELLKKLFFSKNMFNTQDTVKISMKLNPRNATIILKKKWLKNDVNHSMIVVKENYLPSGTETSFTYTLDDNFKFVDWEGCIE